MAVHLQTDTVTVHHGDSLDVLATLPDACVEVVVTDPPYGLAELHVRDVFAALAAWTTGDRTFVPDGHGFMGREWDRFVPPPALWDQVLRVLKPGGHLLAFAGSRTADLMGMAVRLSGFEIRDTITWHHAQGFPKNVNVAAAIDKIRDDRAEMLEVTAWIRQARDRAGITNSGIDAVFGFNGMACHWTTQAAQPIVPTLDQMPQLLAVLGVAAHAVPGRIRELLYELNGRKGTPGRAWLDAEVIATQVRHNAPNGIVGVDDYVRSTPVERQIKAPATAAARQWAGWGTALKPASEPIIVARKPLTGTVARNVLAHGAGAINIDACRTAADVPGAVGRWPSNVVLTHAAGIGPDGEDVVDACADGCVPGCPVAELDDQSGLLKSGANPTRRGSAKFRDAYGDFPGEMKCTPARGADEGGASRFFPVFRYAGKAAPSERPRVGGIAHPTVKPRALMRFLVRLVCPPGGILLDPFAGSGTTVEACLLEGVRCVAVEREATYLPLIQHRINRTGAPGRTSSSELGPDVDELLLF